MMLTSQELFHGFTEVPDQAPPIGNPHGPGRPGADPFCIRVSAIMSHKLNSGMRFESLSQRLSFTIRQEVNRRATFMIDENGSMLLSATKCEVIYPKRSDRSGICNSGASHTFQHRRTYEPK